MKTIRKHVEACWPMWLVAILVTGNLTSSRSFSHIGAGSVFIGEVALGSVLLWKFRVYANRLLYALLKPTELSPVAWTIAISIGYGIFQILRAGLSEVDTVTALKCFPFHLYPLFFFLGVEVGVRQPDFLRRFLTWFAWIHGIYGLAYILVLSPLGLTDGANAVGVAPFSQPYGAALAILGLFAYQASLARCSLPLLLNFFVLLGVQVRAEWLSFVASFSLWCGLTGRVAQVVKVGLAATLLLVVALVADFRLPAPSTRGGEISVRGVVGRSLSSVSPQLAGHFVDDPERYASTVSWRTGWWKAILHKSHQTPTTAIIGLGYGYPIWDFHPEGVSEGLRTPHSITVYALGYTGWIGLAFFLLLQLALAGVLWRAYRQTGEPFGLMCLVLFSVWACVDNLLEAPYGAIPFYLLLGLAAAALVRKTSEQTWEETAQGRSTHEVSP